jgi:hypothetical protein
MSKSRTERQVHEVGVTRADGTVQVCSTLQTAQDRADQLNRMADSLGVPRAAKVVTRRSIVVTTTTSTPWEVSRRG